MTSKYITGGGRPRNTSNWITAPQGKPRNTPRLHGPVDDCTVTRFTPGDPSRTPTETYVVPAAEQRRPIRKLSRTDTDAAVKQPQPGIVTISRKPPTPHHENTLYPTKPQQMTPDQARTILGLDHLSAYPR